MLPKSRKEKVVAQEEAVKKAYMPDVPRPAVFSWGLGLTIVGVISAIFGWGLFISNQGGCYYDCREQEDALALAGLALTLGAGASALGWPMLLLGLLIHAIRVEGAAIRAGVLSPYPEALPPPPAHTDYHGKGQ